MSVKNILEIFVFLLLLLSFVLFGLQLTKKDKNVGSQKNLPKNKR